MLKLNRLCPRYKNWGAPGWSAGRWNDDPETTDWSVPALDAMDQHFKDHDRAYQSGLSRREADLSLVAKLKKTRVRGWWGKVYRVGAICIFTVVGHARRA